MTHSIILCVEVDQKDFLCQPNSIIVTYYYSPCLVLCCSRFIVQLHPLAHAQFVGKAHRSETKFEKGVSDRNSQPGEAKFPTTRDSANETLHPFKHLSSEKILLADKSDNRVLYRCQSNFVTGSMGSQCLVAVLRPLKSAVREYISPRIIYCIKGLAKSGLSD